MHPRMAPSLRQVEETFGSTNVASTELPDGFVWIDVAAVDLGPGWNPDVTTLSVKLAPTFPDTVPYPWYLPSGIGRRDGTAVDRLSGPVDLDGRSLTQVSLNAPWSVDSSLADRMVAVVRWLRKAGQALDLAS
jgi:hypothetical protein